MKTRKRLAKNSNSQKTSKRLAKKKFFPKVYKLSATNNNTQLRNPEEDLCNLSSSILHMHKNYSDTGQTN